jgi:hypothetical protein
MADTKKRKHESLIDALVEDLKKDSESVPDDVLKAPPPPLPPPSITNHSLKVESSKPPSGDDDRTTLLAPPPVPPPFKKTKTFPKIKEISEEELLQLVANETRVVTPQKTPSAPEVFEEKEPSVQTAFGAQTTSATQAGLAQFEGLKVAQERILELEKEVELLRRENELFLKHKSAHQDKIEELLLKVQSLEKTRHDLKEQSETENRILRDTIQYKEAEITRLKLKLEEADSKVSVDVRRVRIRERDLENRLELARVEKNALLKSKDEMILELKRKLDFLTSEVENYKEKCLEQSQRLEATQEKLNRASRALRATLTNIDVEENSDTLTAVPIKKAE